MNTTVPLVANGLPFELTSFTNEGTLTNLDDVEMGGPAVIDPVLTGPHTHELPLNLQVVSFDP